MRDGSVLLIFDFDNTLIDSRIDFTALRADLVTLLAAAGPLPAARDELLRRPIPALAALGAQTSAALARSMWDSIEAYEADGLRGATVIAHAPEVLESLKASGHTLAVLTNNTRPATARVLAEHRLTPLFALLVTRDDVPAMKPDPAGVRFILERLGPAPDAYLIGDSWIDGKAAEDAGIRFVGFGERRAEVEARGVQPWAWVTDLRELLAMRWR